MRDARQTQGYPTDTWSDTTAREPGRMRTLTLVLALLAILLTGCGSNEGASATAIDGDGNAQTGDARPACPNPEGGECLGALEPGTYTTVSFSPAITYTVPAGWTNGEDLPGNFLLEDGIRYIGIFRDVNAPYKCEEHPDFHVSQAVSDYTRWLRRHPLLHVTKPRPVAVGGLHGVVMDISKAPGTEGKGCNFDKTTTGVVPIIIGGRGPASLHHVILDTPGWKERLYLLRHRGGNVAIEIGPKGDSMVKYVKKVTPILQSLRFTKSLTGDRPTEETTWNRLTPPWPA
jgi:hypothetical protein